METKTRGGPESPQDRRDRIRRQRRLGVLSELSTRLALGRAISLRGGGALSVPVYREFWLASIVSNIGSWMQMVAQGWLILQLTDSAFYLGLVGLMRAIPALSITLVGGVLADRVDRRRMLLFTQATAGLLALLLGLLDLFGVVAIWHILVIAFASAAVMALDNPTRQALVPDLVGKENIPSAVGLNSAAWNGAAVVGPALAGLLVAAVGTAGAFLLNGASYVAVLWVVGRMPPQPPKGNVRESIAQNLAAGLRYMRGDPRIWGLMLVIGVATFFGRPYLQFMPVFAQDVLGTGPTGYGVLMAANGIGALAGAIAVAPLGASRRKGELLILITALFGASLLLFAGSRWYLPSLLLLVLVGAAQTLNMGLTNTLLQLTVPGELRGRVMAAYTLVPMGLMPLGQLLVGSLGARTTVPVAVALGAGVVTLFSLAAAWALPAVRKMP
ncbi:MAG: MFS transporter [Sphaerobacter sp.]|nr:MFS transporter [Sphaerobacter sp.]